MLKIAALVSGGGTNLQALIDSIAAGHIKGAVIDTVISSNNHAFALVRAKRHGIDFAVFAKKNFADEAARGKALLEYLQRRGIGLIVMCGSLMILCEELIRIYEKRIINIHPSLLPDFGGRGMHGIAVHQAVLAAGVNQTGATAHYVNEVIDGGEIILQQAVDVLPDDTPESLQQRVLGVEWQILPKAVKIFLGE
ncbi:MAG: phosphoribosylglycinamide formyltransferase [Defluviitaleaceae bacterium]|nr:phosphoribosylglycinamide formyltransferase [Defluviitaleaceae bacterium]